MTRSTDPTDVMRSASLTTRDEARRPSRHELAPTLADPGEATRETRGREAWPAIRRLRLLRLFRMGATLPPPGRTSVKDDDNGYAQLPDNVLHAQPEEGDALEALRRQIEEIFRTHRTARLTGPDGESMVLPASAFHALKLVVQGMARGQTMTLVPHGKELTTQEAADLLHVSRPHLVKLLDAGEIPHYKVGTHRRVRIEDVLAYREARAAVRRGKLDELTRLSEELEGGYR